MATKTSDNEFDYKHSYRFANPFDLWERFNQVVSLAREKAVEREKLIKMYDRHSYKTRKNSSVTEPNWGTFRDAVDDYIKFFSSIAFNRKIWCRIETHEGWKEGLDETWSDNITHAFHKFCIDLWKGKSKVIIKAIRDDAMFNRGVLMWETPAGFDTYPCHIPMEDVFTDTNATTCPDSIDILFIRKRFTAVELYKKATDPRNIELGWNKKAILRSLSKQLDSLKDCKGVNSVIDRWRRGGVSQSEKDTLIPIIFAYVKEYKENEEDGPKKGNTISKFVFPENIVALGVGPNTNRENYASLNKDDYFMYSDYYAKSFKSLIAIWSASLEHAFFDDESFAKQIYPSSRFHDRTFNRVIRGFIRSSRQWIKTSSADTKERLKKMDPDSEVELLNSDDDVAQVNMRQDISGGTELMRSAQSRIAAFNPSEFQGTQNSPKGYPITKGEAQILNSQLDDSKSTAITIATDNDESLMCELYYRFINSSEESDTYEGFKRFKAFLEFKGVPEKAWAYENVSIFPRFNKFAGNASSNFATAQGLVQATQIKPASIPEQRAKRDLIAALIGEANVHDYMEQPMQIDNELFIIGQENEVLDNPHANPTNIPVTSSDNHIMHIQGHLQDYMTKLGMASQLLSQAQQDQSFMRQFMIDDARKVILAQDNKGAHIAAHFQIVGRDKSKQDEVKQLAGIFQEAQSKQDQLQSQLEQLIQQEVQNNSRQNMFDLEYQHKQRMYQLDEEHAMAKNNLDAAKKVQQIEGAQLSSDRSQEQSMRHKEQEAQLKQAEQRQQVAGKVAMTQLDIEKKQIENQLKREKPKKTTTNEKSNESAA